MKHVKIVTLLVGTMAASTLAFTGCGSKEAPAETAATSTASSEASQASSAASAASSASAEQGENVDQAEVSEEAEAIRSENPKTVVSLAPNVTEILYAVGAGDMVVGRTDYCDFPKEAADVDSIGTFSSPNLELIVSKAPDLVIASESLNETIENQLKDNGISVYVSESSNVDEIEREIENIGYMLGHEEEAKELVASMDEKEAEIVEMGKDIAEVKSAFIDLGGFYTAGTGSFLDAVLKDIHLTNIAADTGEEWPQLSVELIAEGNPDVYLSFYTSEDELKNESTLASLDCMKNGGLYVIDYDLGSMLQRQGPRIVDAEMELMKMVYNK